MRAWYSLKTAISLLVLGLGLILIAVDWSKTEGLLRNRSVARLEREALGNGARIAGLMQHSFRNDQPRVAELEMGYASLLPDLALGVVADETGVVRHATRLMWRGVPLDQSPIAPRIGSIGIFRDSPDGFLDRDEATGRVTAYFPFYTSYGSENRGIVALAYDAGAAIRRAEEDATRESIGRTFYLASACLLLWIALDFLVTRRVEQLLAFARSVREGAPLANPGSGSDELGLIADTFAESVEKLRESEARLLDASEEERRRIGRDIHDDVCQRIAAAQLKCGVLGSKLAREGLEHSALAGEVAKELQEAVSISRGVAHGLSPVRVGTEGLAAALSELGDLLERSFDVTLTIEADINSETLDNRARTHIFRILQELMTNAAKHAQPKLIEARATLDGRHLELEVEDDGIGFIPDEKGSAGLGLPFVEQRVRALGGHLRFLPRRDGRRGTLAIVVAELLDHHFQNV